MRTTIVLSLSPKEAFEHFSAVLRDSLEKEGLECHLEPNGKITDGAKQTASVTKWQPPYAFEINWRTSPSLGPALATDMRVIFEPREGGRRTEITIEDEGSSDLIFKDGQDVALEWFASEIATNLLLASSPDRLVNFVIDRRARRPEGPGSRAIYRDPIYHRPNFRAILQFLDLQEDDFLLEVGCGGGAFLSDALKSGCRAAAIDHSPDMVRVARDLNSDAINSNRLEIQEREAESPLPYPDDTFSAAVMTGVFAFFEQPLGVLKEINRVLRSGGRLVVFTGSKELKGTPAAPEPMASRLHFYEDEELIELARDAGFVEVRVEKPSLEEFAREVGVPKEAMPLFRGPNSGGQFLLGSKG